MQNRKTILMQEIDVVAGPQVAVLVGSHWQHYLCAANAKCENEKMQTILMQKMDAVVGPQVAVLVGS